MYKGKLVFAQLTEHLPKEVFAASVARYAGKYPTLTFSYWDQFLCMMFAQLTARSSLRDITTCLRSHAPKLYHAGFRGPIARSTLADANERRDCRIFEGFALHLIALARSLYANEILAQELEQTVYAIDATTIDLCGHPQPTLVRASKYTRHWTCAATFPPSSGSRDRWCTTQRF